MRLSIPDIPRRAAAVAVALALIASIVSGVEGPSTEVATPAAPQALPAAGPAGAAAIPDLDLDKLNRAREGKKVTDLFASRTLAPPSPPVLPPAAAVLAPPAPTAPPEPTAPALPFRYFGKWIEGDRTVVFLWNNNEGFSAAVGETVAGSYRIESMTDSAIDFTYLPLGSKQTLAIAKPD
jgi:hypothetical protein